MSEYFYKLLALARRALIIGKNSGPQKVVANAASENSSHVSISTAPHIADFYMQNLWFSKVDRRDTAISFDSGRNWYHLIDQNNRCFTPGAKIEAPVGVWRSRPASLIGLTIIEVTVPSTVDAGNNVHIIARVGRGGFSVLDESFGAVDVDGRPLVIRVNGPANKLIPGWRQASLRLVRYDSCDGEQMDAMSEAERQEHLDYFALLSP